MRHALQVAKVRGIPIRVHWSFGLLVILVVMVQVGSGTVAAMGAVLWLVLLFASVVFHELAHCLVARRRGIDVRDIVLLPIGGASEIPDLARTPEDELHIAVAGPLSSLVLAMILGAVSVLTGGRLWPPTLTGGGLLVDLAWVNMVLAGFNLLPALPMDGGRVLRSVLTRFRPEPRATAIAVRVGQAFGFAMVLFGVFVDLWLVLIGLFVLFGARSEGQAALVHAALGNRRVGDLPMAGPVILPAWMPVGHAVGSLGTLPGLTVVVVDQGGYLGLLTSERLATAPHDAPIGSVADREAPLLAPEAPLFPAALDAFGRTRARSLAVGTGGRVSGMVAARDVEVMLHRTAAVRG
ncbi:MAG: site-2 protease family protein [Acidimicrobiales bacterium]